MNDEPSKTESTKLNLGLTQEEINLFKNDPETFREYLKYKTRQMEINAEIIKNETNKEYDEHLKSYELKLKFESEESERKLRAEAEENERKRQAIAQENERKRQAEAEENAKRRADRNNFIYALVGASSMVITYFEEKDKQKKAEEIQNKQMCNNQNNQIKTIEQK